MSMEIIKLNIIAIGHETKQVINGNQQKEQEKLQNLNTQ